MSTADDLLFAPIGVKASIMIPQMWLKVLHEIQNQPAWNNAILSGGALRDLDNGRPVKDVDIFVPFLDNESAAKKLEDVISKLPDPNGTELYEMEHNVNNTSQVGQTGISHFIFKQDGWSFEISQTVASFNYQSLLDSFDIGLCMISIDDNDNIYRADHYKTDKTNQTITIVNHTGGKEQVHAERILAKYSGWRIIPL